MHFKIRSILRVGFGWARAGVVGLSLSLGWASCAGPPPRGDVTASGRQAVQPIRNVPPILASKLYPLKERSGRIEYHVDGAQPRQLPYQLESLGPSRWRWTLDSVRVAYLSQTDEGTIVIDREEELAKGVSVEYQPSLVLLPRRIGQDSVVHGSSQMVVRNLVDGSVRDRGLCSYTIQLLGARKVTSPFGSRDAYIIKTFREIRLSLATSSVLIEVGYVPYRGWIMEGIQESTRVLQLFEARSNERLRLID